MALVVHDRKRRFPVELDHAIGLTEGGGNMKVRSGPEYESRPVAERDRRAAT